MQSGLITYSNGLSCLYVQIFLLLSCKLHTVPAVCMNILAGVNIVAGRGCICTDKLLVHD